MQTAAKLRIPWDRYRLIAVPEVAAAIGLLIGYASAPFGAAAGIGLAVLMAGALFFRLRVHDSVGYLLADAAQDPVEAVAPDRFWLDSGRSARGNQ